MTGSFAKVGERKPVYNLSIIIYQVPHTSNNKARIAKNVLARGLSRISRRLYWEPLSLGSRLGLNRRLSRRRLVPSILVTTLRSARSIARFDGRVARICCPPSRRRAPQARFLRLMRRTSNDAPRPR